MLTIFILIIVSWIDHHWWVGRAGYWLLVVRLDDTSELRVGCGGQRSSWWRSYLLGLLFFILALTWNEKQP